METKSLMTRLRDWIGCAYLLPSWLRKLVTALIGKAGENFEVERKYPLTPNEHEDLPAKLQSMGFRHDGQVYMHDYFLPTNQVANNNRGGDMLRLRDETMDDRTKHLFTNKIWVMVAGKQERKEKEEEISALIRELLLDLGTRMNGGPLPNFTKERDLYTRQDKQQSVTVTIDKVDGLGVNDGFYLEVEILVRREADVEQARTAIEELAVEILGDKRDFAISYMEMLKQHLAQK
jgi:predicted adenylyl cyclase CyaB